MIKYVIHDNRESLITFHNNNSFDFTINLLNLVNDNSFDKKLLWKNIMFNQINKFKNKTLHIAPILGDKDISNFVTSNIKYFSEIVISDFFGEIVNKDSDLPIKFPLYYSWYKNYVKELYVYNKDSNSLIPYSY